MTSKKNEKKKPWEQSQVVVHQMKLGTMDNFVYILGDRNSGTAAVIDPGWDFAAIIDNAQMLGLRLTKILLTHHHYDHVKAVDQLIDHLPAGETEVYMYDEEVRFSGYSHKLLKKIGHEESVQLGSLKIEVIPTPGHTPGSVCFFVDGNLFTGDTLFVGDCGRCDLPGGSEAAMTESLKSLLKKFPEDTIVWPGHDYGKTPQSTLGEQKRTNPCMQF